MWVAYKEVGELLNRADARVSCLAAGDLCEREIGHGRLGFNLAPSALAAGKLLKNKSVHIEQFVSGCASHDLRRLVIYGSRIAAHG